MIHIDRRINVFQDFLNHLTELRDAGYLSDGLLDRINSMKGEYKKQVISYAKNEVKAGLFKPETVFLQTALEQLREPTELKLQFAELEERFDLSPRVFNNRYLEGPDDIIKIINDYSKKHNLIPGKDRFIGETPDETLDNIKRFLLRDDLKIMVNYLDDLIKDYKPLITRIRQFTRDVKLLEKYQNINAQKLNIQPSSNVNESAEEVYEALKVTSVFLSIDSLLESLEKTKEFMTNDIQTTYLSVLDTLVIYEKDGFVRDQLLYDLESCEGIARNIKNGYNAVLEGLKTHHSRCVETLNLLSI